MVRPKYINSQRSHLKYIACTLAVCSLLTHIPVLWFVSSKWTELEKSNAELRELFNQHLSQHNVQAASEEIIKVKDMLMTVQEKRSQSSNQSITTTRQHFNQSSIMNSSVNVILPPEQVDGSSVYIRWGRFTCSGGAVPVYTGFAASSSYLYGRGGTDIQCLHSTPEWTSESSSASRISMAAITYDTFDRFTNQGSATNAVPCARCLNYLANVIMIPGRLTCPDTWTEQYTGYLMAGSTHLSNHICVDKLSEQHSEVTPRNNGRKISTVMSDNIYNGQTPSEANNKKISCVMCAKNKDNIT